MNPLNIWVKYQIWDPKNLKIGPKLHLTIHPYFRLEFLSWLFKDKNKKTFWSVTFLFKYIRIWNFDNILNTNSENLVKSTIDSIEQRRKRSEEIDLNAVLHFCGLIPFIASICKDVDDKGYTIQSETNRYRHFLKLKMEKRTFVEQLQLDSYLSFKDRFFNKTFYIIKLLINFKSFFDLLSGIHTTHASGTNYFYAFIDYMDSEISLTLFEQNKKSWL